jgi:hypothetical protein
MNCCLNKSHAGYSAGAEWQRKVKLEKSGTAGENEWLEKHSVCYILFLLQRRQNNIMPKTHSYLECE